MGRYFLEIVYNGTNYHGWQIQKNANSVQVEINNALSTILQHPIHVTGAGRTDTGVHALQMFAHFDISEISYELDQLAYKMNSFLPNDISCKQILPVGPEAHARFSATSRTYQYHITPFKNPFYSDTAYFFPTKLSLEKMNDGAQKLIRETDFSCFSKSNTDTHTNNCKITEAYWKKQDDQLIFTISADRFLRNMVRAIVGTLMSIGQEKITVDAMEQIIASKNRKNAGTSVPAHGLFLTKVEYPKEIFNVYPSNQM